MTELPTDLLDLAKDVLIAAKASRTHITTAESCTVDWWPVFSRRSLVRLK